MKTIYSFIAAIIFSVHVYAQTPGWLWAKGMGGVGSDAGNSIAIDDLGHVYTTGTFVGTVDFDPGAGVFNLTSTDSLVIDVFVCKTDTGGHFIWAKSIGGMDMDASWSIAFNPSGTGAIYFSGYFKGTADFDPNAGVFNLTSASPTTSDIFICKLDTAGNLIWAKTMGGGSDDNANAIALDPAGTGDIYCTGYFRGTADFDPNAGIFNLTAAGNTDVFVSKYNSLGNLIWAKAMGGSAHDGSLFLAKCPAGNTDVYTTGYFGGTGDFDPGAGTFNLTSSGFEDIFISKLDSAGNFVWAKALGGADGDFTLSIASDIAGNVYTTGRFRGIADFDPGAGTFNLTSAGSDDIFISKLDNAGNFVWAKGIGGVNYDSGSNLVLDANNNVYTLGGFTGTVDFDPGAAAFNLSSAGNVDMFISKIDDSGNFVWVNQVGGTNGDNGRALTLDPSGHLFATGTFSSASISFTGNTLSNAGQSDIFIAKMDKVFTVGMEPIGHREIQFSLFPNPFTDELTVRTSEAAELKIYDVLGKLLYTQKPGNEQRITTPWPNGIYFLEVLTDGGRAVMKVVKQ